MGTAAMIALVALGLLVLAFAVMGLWTMIGDGDQKVILGVVGMIVGCVIVGFLLMAGGVFGLLMGAGG